MLSAKKELFTPSAGGYQISRSVRFRPTASAYFTRTPPSGSGGQSYTLSMWVKRGTLGTVQALCSANYTNSVFFDVIFNTGNTLEIYLNAGAGSEGFISTSVYRDTSAWYHIMIVGDHTNATAANRLKIFVNGVAAPGTYTYPSTGFSTSWNIGTRVHGIGVRPNATYQWYFDGYIAEFHSVDGQSLTPASFGETNPITGVWQPKKYAGTYGTNGFYLNFSDNSNNTATTIGKDYSGNGNNWTPNNISVTAGATYDSMIDVPTPYADGGNGRGNYCVLNPLQDSATLANGNLDATSLSSYSGRKATMQLPTTGKWYWETTVSNTSTTAGNWFIFGMVTNSFALTSAAVGAANAISFGDRNDSVSGVFNETTTVFSSASINFATNDILQCAYDADSGKFWFGKNNSWYDSSGTTTGNPATGSNQTLTASAKEWFPFFQGNNTSSVANLNFGQRPFTYTPPTGFVALNTQNLSAPTISNGANYMAATTYTGTGSALSVSNAVNGVSFQPDFVWTKPRSTAVGHTLFDSLRGVTKYLQSNTTGAEGTAATSLTAFNSDGFTVNSDTSTGANGVTYIGWQWNAGGSTVTNTSGSISAQVRANATAGFSVVTYTGTGANATVGHGLGVAPKMIIFKNKGSTNAWCIYHSAISPANFLQFDTSAQLSSTTYPMFGTTPTAATSTVFSIGTNAQTNAASSFVAYCFAAVAGYSAFGSYTGNNLADGPFVYLGFRPRFIMFKDASANGVWMIMDTARNTYNVLDDGLAPNNANAESSYSNTAQVDFLSNGFKIRATNANQYWNNISGNTIIYAAFAESPFRNSLAF